MIDMVACNRIFKVLLYIFTVNRGFNETAIKTLRRRITAGQTYWNYVFDILIDKDYVPATLENTEDNKAALDIYRKMRVSGLTTDINKLFPEMLNFYSEVEYEPQCPTIIYEFKPYNILSNMGPKYGYIGTNDRLKINSWFVELFHHLIELKFEFLEFQTDYRDSIGDKSVFYIVKNEIKNTYDLLCPMDSYSDREKSKVMSYLLHKYLLHHTTKYTTFIAICKEGTQIFGKKSKHVRFTSE